MQDKLQALEDKYLDLEAKISDPDVIANQAEWQKYARAHAKLTDVVAAYREYKILDKAREEAEEIIADGSDRELAAMAQEELKDLKPQLAEYEERLKILLLPSDPNDDKNAIVEIRGGAGGEEAALFAGVLFRMYQHYAESRRWSLEIMDASPTELGGFKEIVFQLSGQGVFGRMKFESGVHRVQRIPVTESQGRIQTSAAGVIVFPEADEDDDEIEIDPKDLKIDIFMSSGPGGQSVNTTYSAVRMTHIPTGITVNMQDEKSQIQNRAAALRVLKSRLLAMKHEQEAAEAADMRHSQVRSLTVRNVSARTTSRKTASSTIARTTRRTTSTPCLTAICRP
mgnify:CR=1 FL=1